MLGVCWKTFPGGGKTGTGHFTNVKCNPLTKEKHTRAHTDTRYTHSKWWAVKLELLGKLLHPEQKCLSNAMLCAQLKSFVFGGFGATSPGGRVENRVKREEVDQIDAGFCSLF